MANYVCVKCGQMAITSGIPEVRRCPKGEYCAFVKQN